MTRLTPEQLTDAKSRLPQTKDRLAWDSTDYQAKFTNAQLRILIDEIEALQQEKLHLIHIANEIGEKLKTEEAEWIERGWREGMHDGMEEYRKLLNQVRAQFGV